MQDKTGRLKLTIDFESIDGTSKRVTYTDPWVINVMITAAEYYREMLEARAGGEMSGTEFVACWEAAIAEQDYLTKHQPK